MCPKLNTRVKPRNKGVGHFTLVSDPVLLRFVAPYRVSQKSILLDRYFIHRNFPENFPSTSSFDGEGGSRDPIDTDPLTTTATSMCHDCYNRSLGSLDDRHWHPYVVVPDVSPRGHVMTDESPRQYG